jgi:hypothetical protein
LFGLTGTAAAGAGGALAGGFNAAINDQNILTGALKGGLGSAGALEIGDTGFKLGDINKAINFAKDPTLTGAFNLASPYLDTNFNIGDTGISLNDVVKGKDFKDKDIDRLDATYRKRFENDSELRAKLGVGKRGAGEVGIEYEIPLKKGGKVKVKTPKVRGHGIEKKGKTKGRFI